MVRGGQRGLSCSGHASILRIERPGLDKADLHPSETSVEHVVADGVIVNEGDRRSFYNKVEKHFDKLLQRKQQRQQPHYCAMDC